MTMQFFLTAPLILGARSISAGDCAIRLNGRKGLSSIEGPDSETIHDVLDDLICVLRSQGKTELLSVRVVIGLTSEKKIANLKDSPVRSEECWLSWAFAHLPLETVPLVFLDEDLCACIEITLNENVER